MIDLDRLTLDCLDCVKKAQQASMTEAMRNTILGQVIFKTGRTSYSTQEDFLKYHLEVLRDQIMAVSFCAMSTMLLKTGVSPEVKDIIRMLLDTSNEELQKSTNKFKNLREHLRQEHIQELSNELAKAVNAVQASSAGRK